MVNFMYQLGRHSVRYLITLFLECFCEGCFLDEINSYTGETLEVKQIITP